jgi:hypothetical protein
LTVKWQEGFVVYVAFAVSVIALAVSLYALHDLSTQTHALVQALLPLEKDVHDALPAPLLPESDGTPGETAASLFAEIVKLPELKAYSLSEEEEAEMEKEAIEHGAAVKYD